MNIVESINSDENNLEETANKFADLVNTREYVNARNYFHQLNEAEKKYIRKNERYNKWLRVLSFSNL